MGDKSYVFKWSNYNLEEYIAARKSLVRQKRKEAEMLMKEASTIEGECIELEMALIESPPTESKVQEKK